MDPGRDVNATPFPVNPARAEPGRNLTLVLGAAEGNLQIGIAGEDGRMLFGHVMEAASRGAEILAPALESAFVQIGRDIRDIARIAVVRGPGSFTGLRLTAATSAGLARTIRAKQAGLDNMRCLALECLPQLRAAPEAAQIWILMRARRDLVYLQGFKLEKGSTTSLRPLGELSVMPVSSGDTARYILSTATLCDASAILFAGSGLEENRDALAAGFASGGASAMRISFLEITAPRPDTLLLAARDADYGDADIEPLYARVSDAEANLPAIAARLGLDPKDAVHKLHKLTRALPQEDC